MAKFPLLPALLVFSLAVAGDLPTDLKQQDRDRASYWAQRGYHFDPNYMTAWAMDQKVQNIERAKYWAQRGYNFDANYMTAWAMDQKVQNIERAKYWAQRGYNFDANYMTAWAMDQKVQDIERAKYWAQRGYNFDANYMTAWAMDQAAARGRNIEPNSSGGLTARAPSGSQTTAPAVAENGSYYGEPNKNGVPKDVYVHGYFRKDGTYVGSHYRSRPYSNPK